MSNSGEKDALPNVSYGTPTLNEWKQYFRNMKQPPVVQREETPESSEESSFELDESFRALLDRKRQQLQEKANEEDMLSDEEAAATVRGKEGATGVPKFLTGNDSTFLEASISKVSDTSFEEMEKMCAVQERAAQLSLNPATAVPVDQQKQIEVPVLVHSTTFGDVTQLDDVDEPTGLWDNTILHGTGQVLSPMKRVHLFRPSTIIEESTITDAGGSKNSSIETYASARQRESQEEAESRSSAVTGSEVYRTAEETFATDSYARSSVGVDSELIYDNTAIHNRTEAEHRDRQEEDESGYSKNSTAEATGLTDGHNVIVLNSSSSSSESEHEEPHYRQQFTSQLPTVDSTLGEKDDEQGKFQAHEQSSFLDDLEDAEDKDANLSELEEMPDRFNDTMEETDFMLRQGMKLMAMQKKKDEQEEEQHSLRSAERAEPLAPQQQYQHKSRTNSDSDDGASAFDRHFLQPSFDKDESKMTNISNFSYLTPSNAMKSKVNVPQGTGSGCKQTLFSSTGKNSSAKKLPGPPSGGGSATGGTFKRPVISRLPQLKVGRKFDHIVSPIGAYIKKTPQSILQTKITCPNKNLIDVLHSENRDSVMSSRCSKENQHGLAAGGAAKAAYTPSLPGKGVISSNRAHVLDERNLMRIPGGEKMQKLINNSPTMVIRHEGRIRYAGESGGAGRKLMMSDSTFGDDSLKDISVASNDVSVRVLHDAKRF